jgi:hypothetical protein
MTAGTPPVSHLLCRSLRGLNGQITCQRSLNPGAFYESQCEWLERMSLRFSNCGLEVHVAA